MLGAVKQHAIIFVSVDKDLYHHLASLSQNGLKSHKMIPTTICVCAVFKIGIHWSIWVMNLGIKLHFFANKPTLNIKETFHVAWEHHCKQFTFRSRRWNYIQIWLNMLIESFIEGIVVNWISNEKLIREWKSFVRLGDIHRGAFSLVAARKTVITERQMSLNIIISIISATISSKWR